MTPQLSNPDTLSPSFQTRLAPLLQYATLRQITSSKTKNTDDSGGQNESDIVQLSSLLYSNSVHVAILQNTSIQIFFQKKLTNKPWSQQ